MAYSAEQYDISGGGTRSEQAMRDILDSDMVAGIPIHIKPMEDNPWGPPYETLFGIPEGNRKYTVAPVFMNVRDWLKIQQKAHGMSSEQAFRRGAYQETVNRVAKDIENGTTSEIPTPVLEVSETGDVTWAEGRSRGLGAEKAGLDYMPIWIATRDYR